MKFRRMPDGTRRQPKIKTALVLSGGGAKGAYQIGVICEMLKRGINFDLITGSSIGAFNGAILTEFINNNLSTLEIEESLKDIWWNMRGFLPLNWFEFMSKFFCPWNIASIFSNQNIIKTLDCWLGCDRTFSHYTDCQLSVIGTNVERKESVVFDFNSRIRVRDAVLASMAFPVGLPSVVINDENYIDGGFLNNAPLKEAILWGARRIYVVFLAPLSLIEGDNDDNKEYNKPLSAWQIINLLPELIENKLMYGDLERAKEINQLLRLIEIYERELPSSFLEQLRQLFKLKKGAGKRVLEIVKIAPEKVLDPPGTIGFNQTKTLRRLIIEGERDAASALSDIN